MPRKISLIIALLSLLLVVGIGNIVGIIFDPVSTKQSHHSLHPSATLTLRPTILIAPFDYSWQQSPVIRIASDGCINSVSINKTGLKLPFFASDNACLESPITLQLAPYLSSSEKNTLRIAFSESSRPQKIHIESIYSSFIVALMTACALLHPFSKLVRRIWLNRAGIPSWVRAHLKHTLILVAGVIVAMTERGEVLPFNSVDYKLFLNDWVNYIRTHGLFEAYGAGFTNYSPLYTYFLGIGDLYMPTVPNLYVIKGVTFIGELFAAFWIYKIVAIHYRTTPHSVMPLTAALLLLLCPTVIVNGAGTGQCDIWYAGFLFAALYHFLKERPYAGLIYAGLACSFKLQAIFLSPLLLIFVLWKKVPWYAIAIVPCVYVLTVLPCWFEGRPFMNLLTIYWTKFLIDSINMNAANVYLFLDGYGYNAEYVSQMGLIFTVEVAGVLIYLSSRHREIASQTLPIVLLATLFAGLMPFVLPKMHDRYFFVADVMSLLLACLQPRWFIIPILFQSATLTATPFTQFPPMHGLMSWIQELGIRTGVILNATAISILLWLCWKHIWKRSPIPLQSSATWKAVYL